MQRIKPKYDKERDVHYYNPVAGERVDIVAVVDYPDYQFVFGVPAPDTMRHVKEAGFIEYVDFRTGRRTGLYLDVSELKDFELGIAEILRLSKENSPHLHGQEGAAESKEGSDMAQSN